MSANKIESILSGLKAQEFEPSQIVYNDSRVGRIEVVVFDITEPLPKVEFRVRRKGSSHPESFATLMVAFAYLFRGQ